jgi:hypothetical protein
MSLSYLYHTPQYGPFSSGVEYLNSNGPTYLLSSQVFQPSNHIIEYVFDLCGVKILERCKTDSIRCRSMAYMLIPVLVTAIIWS